MEGVDFVRFVFLFWLVMGQTSYKVPVVFSYKVLVAFQRAKFRACRFWILRATGFPQKRITGYRDTY